MVKISKRENFLNKNNFKLGVPMMFEIVAVEQSKGKFGEQFDVKLLGKEGDFIGDFKISVFELNSLIDAFGDDTELFKGKLVDIQIEEYLNKDNQKKVKFCIEPSKKVV